MPLPNQVPQWKDWTDAEKARYTQLSNDLSSGIRISDEDYSWYSLRRRNLQFYASVRSRYYKRCRAGRWLDGDITSHRSSYGTI